MDRVGAALLHAEAGIRGDERAREGSGMAYGYRKECSTNLTSSSPAIPSVPTGITRSFKDVVSGGSSSSANRVKFVHASFKGCPALLFEDSVVSQLAAPFSSTLVGKFVMHRPNLDVIRKFFYSLKLFGSFNVGLLDPRHIAIQFSNDLDYSRIFARRSYYIQEKGSARINVNGDKEDMPKSQNVVGNNSGLVDLVLKEGEQLGLVNLVKEVEVNPTTNVFIFSALNLDNIAIDPIANGNDNIVNESSSNLVPSLNPRIHQEYECSSRGPDSLVLDKWQDAIPITSSDNLVVVLDLGEVESSKANELPNTNELNIAKNDSSL
ncbi:hypothetical protein MA16_Dca017043 [Dendrobium catenatum]|uniref:DUF4283 domain-containing protein n=1 Tax=Dendrobium catenatum TaxID=906689 RepID=A0A2I0W5W4_9ASPA|nr:hypothetical protein MA16_Dca017043 [Dendrobium catenatum]